MLCLGRLSRTHSGVRHCSTAQPKTLKSLKSAALDVHRQLINQLKKWPVEEGREERSLKNEVVPSMERRLKDLSEASDKERILELGTRSQEELSAVTDLLSNKYLKQAYVVPPVLEKQEKLLSTRSQKKMKGRKWGFIDRILTWYFDDDTKPKKDSNSK